MKHFVLIAALFLVSTTALADDTVAPAEKFVLLKSSTQQHALAESLSARIKSALLGERYTLTGTQVSTEDAPQGR